MALYDCLINGSLELEDLLRMPNDNAPTLSLLDSTLRRFLTLCATYHGLFPLLDTLHFLDLTYVCGAEQYLQSPLQLEHAFNMLLGSELFQFHSERMCEIIVEEGLKVCTSGISGSNRFLIPHHRRQILIRSLSTTTLFTSMADEELSLYGIKSGGKPSSRILWTIFLSTLTRMSRIPLVVLAPGIL